MPSSTERKKGKSKEDTWGAPELTNKLRDAHTDREKRSREKHRDSERRERKSTEKTDPLKKSSEEKRGGSRDRRRREDNNKEERRKERDGRAKTGRDGSRERERWKGRDDERRSSHKEDRKREKGGERRDDGHRRKRTEEDLERKRDHDNRVTEEHRAKPDSERGVRESEEERRKRKKREKREKEKQLEEGSKRNGSLDDRSDERRKHKDRETEQGHREEQRYSTNKEKGSSDRERKKRDEDYEEEKRRRKEEKKRLKQEEEQRKQEVARMESLAKVSEPDKNPEANGYDYDDDFEDYDDDFEDEDDDSVDVDQGNSTEKMALTGPSVDAMTVEELRQAMVAENKLTSSSEPKDAVASTFKDSSQRGGRKTFINFTAAQQRQISNTVAERTRRRGEVLMRLIELDTVTYDFFDMPPVKDYDRFIQHYGRSDSTQAAVQCNDDNLDRDIQTDEIDYHDKWCQHPAEGTHCSGGDGINEESELTVNQEAHSLRLNQFLESAGQLIAALLEENRADEEDGGSLHRNQTNLVFSDGYTHIKADLPSIKDCAIVDVEVHPVQTHLILAAYGQNSSQMDEASSPGRGILCVWNVNDPSQPQKILTCRSPPSCCLWSPSKANMAFAGTGDGSVVVWDLREPYSLHSHHTMDSRQVRVPTFTTDGVMMEESHTSRVVSLLPIVTAQGSLRASMSQSEGSDVTFQLATLEEKGVMNFWVVLEIAKTSQAGSESELGVIPGGRVKLVWSSSVCLNVPRSDPNLPADFRVTCFKLDPQVPSQFYVGTDQGVVLHASRHGGAVYPKIYRGEFVPPVEVTSLVFSPFGLSCFLVGCSDGSIRLHSTVCEFPLLSWPSSTIGLGIAAIAWSQSRPSIFYSAGTDCRVSIWSLLDKDGSPVKEEQLSGGRLTALVASHDYSASSIGRPGRHPELVKADSEGSIEVYRLNEHFTNASGDELDAMAALLESFT